MGLSTRCLVNVPKEVGNEHKYGKEKCQQDVQRVSRLTL